MPAMQKMMMEFEKQNEMMEFKSEMMDDTMDDIFAADDEEERTDVMVSQLLDEIGVSLVGSMANAPMTAASPGPLANEAEDDELKARLNSLRALPK